MIGGTQRLYSIDLVNGASVEMGALALQLSGLAVGQVVVKQRVQSEAVAELQYRSPPPIRGRPELKLRGNCRLKIAAARRSLRGDSAFLAESANKGARIGLTSEISAFYLHSASETALARGRNFAR